MNHVVFSTTTPWQSLDPRRWSVQRRPVRVSQLFLTTLLLGGAQLLPGFRWAGVSGSDWTDSVAGKEGVSDTLCHTLRTCVWSSKTPDLLTLWLWDELLHFTFIQYPKLLTELLAYRTTFDWQVSFSVVGLQTLHFPHLFSMWLHCVSKCLLLDWGCKNVEKN